MQKISKNSSVQRITNRDLQNILKEEIKKRDKNQFLNEGIDKLLEENFIKKAMNFMKGLFGDASKVITTSYKNTSKNINRSQLKGIEEVQKVFSKLESTEQAKSILDAMVNIEERSMLAYKKLAKDSITVISNEGLETNDATAIVAMLMQIAQPAIDPNDGIALEGWPKIKQTLEAVGKAKKEKSEANDEDQDGRESLDLGSDEES